MATSLVPRALTEADAPGSKLDPVEGQQETSDLDTFSEAASERLIASKDEVESFFQGIGFVSALSTTRFYGAQHEPNAPHVFADVVQVGSDDDAEKARDWLHEEALKPCPHSCAVEFAEFDVEGIPGAKGAHRSASEADIEALGNSEDKPFDGYTIDFADGPTPTASRSRGHRGA